MKGSIGYVGFDSRYDLTASGFGGDLGAGGGQAVPRGKSWALAEAIAERERVHELNMNQLALDISAARRTAKDARFPESGLPASAGVLVELDRLVGELERERRLERKAFWTEIVLLRNEAWALKDSRPGQRW